MQENLIIENSWTKIFSILLKSKYVYVKNETQTKRFLKAVCWIIRTGAQWRMLPEYFGSWNSVFKRFSSWVKNKVWEHLFECLIQDADLEQVMIDSTIVRAHASSAGYRYNIPEAMGRSRGGITSKIHVIVEALGLPLKFIVTAGNVNDIKMAKPLIQSIFNSHVIGDKGYDSNDFRTSLIDRNCTPVIPGRSNRKKPVLYDEIMYKERNYIERFFSKIKHFRRISTRYEKTTRNFLAMLHILGALAWLQ